MSEASRTELRMYDIVFPSATNHYGTLFAGEGLALMVKAGVIVASRYSRRTVVAVRTESVDWAAPVKQGQLVELVARIVSVGSTSMTADIELHDEDLLTGNRVRAAHGIFVFVALGADGKPTSVPPLS